MEMILYSLSQYKPISAILGFIFITVETFAPILPLTAIIVANSYILGMWLGFFVSWAGSSIGSIGLYYLANKFSKFKFLKKYENNNKVIKIAKWIKQQKFTSIFISYLCPFIPDFLITIASGFVGIDIKTYISAMMCGKFVMFLFISYIGDGVDKIFYSPHKVIILVVVILLSWIVGTVVNNKIHK